MKNKKTRREKREMRSKKQNLKLKLYRRKRTKKIRKGKVIFKKKEDDRKNKS